MVQFPYFQGTVCSIAHVDIDIDREDEIFVKNIRKVCSDDYIMSGEWLKCQVVGHWEGTPENIKFNSTKV